MSEAHQLTAAVCRLLAIFPGVEVICDRTADGLAEIELLFSNAESLRDLQWLCTTANVVMDPSPRLRDTVSMPQYARISASFAPLDDIASGYLQLLAIHLTWRLHKMGLISSVDANQSLTAWKAAVVVV
jgi:hypothetical protein